MPWSRFSAATKNGRCFDVPRKTDIERFRVRRTLFEVKRKLEEALVLSLRLPNSLRIEPKNAQPTAAHRHR